MTIQRFRTKPVEIEAILFTGNNNGEITKWTSGNFWPVDEEDRHEDPDCIAEVYDKLHSTWIGVKAGQWIIKDALGEFYLCDNETFYGSMRK